MDRGTNDALDRPVLDGVSVLQSGFGVKRKAPDDFKPGVEWQGGHTAGGGSVTVGMGGYGTRLEWLAVSSRSAKLAISLKLMTLWRLYVDETLLQRLAQDLEHMAAARRRLVGAEDGAVGE
jgi:hypothetical protein